MGGWKVIIVSSLSLSLRDERLSDLEKDKKRYDMIVSLTIH